MQSVSLEEKQHQYLTHVLPQTPGAAPAMCTPQQPRRFFSTGIIIGTHPEQAGALLVGDR